MLPVSKRNFIDCTPSTNFQHLPSDVFFTIVFDMSSNPIIIPIHMKRVCHLFYKFVCSVSNNIITRQMKRIGCLDLKCLKDPSQTLQQFWERTIPALYDYPAVPLNNLANTPNEFYRSIGDFRFSANAVHLIQHCLESTIVEYFANGYFNKYEEAKHVEALSTKPANSKLDISFKGEAVESFANLFGVEYDPEDDDEYKRKNDDKLSQDEDVSDEEEDDMLDTDNTKDMFKNKNMLEDVPKEEHTKRFSIKLFWYWISQGDIENLLKEDIKRLWLDLPIHEPNIDGETILFHLVRMMRRHCSKEPTDMLTEVLKHKDCNVNHQNCLGDTALTVAAMFGNMEACEILLAVGADGSIKNEEGKDATFYVQQWITHKPNDDNIIQVSYSGDGEGVLEIVRQKVVLPRATL